MTDSSIVDAEWFEVDSEVNNTQQPEAPSTESTVQTETSTPDEATANLQIEGEKGSRVKIEKDNTTLHEGDGTKRTFDSKSSDSGATHLAAADTEIVSDKDRKPAETPEKTKRVTGEYKDVVQGVKHSAKAAEGHLKNVGPDERAKDRDTLDDADLRGIRQNDQARSRHVAELLRVNDAIETYGKELQRGRELKEDEIRILKEAYLDKYDKYRRQKEYYKQLNLPEEDQKLLLDAHFKEELKNFDSSLMDGDGKFNSGKCTIEQLYLLQNTEKEKISKLYVQDRTARQEDSESDDRRKREEEYKKEFKEKYGMEWSVNAERLLQDKNLLIRQNELYEEELNKKNDKKEPEKPEVEKPEIEKAEEKIVEKAKQRNWKKILFWTGAGAGLATGILATGPVVASAAVIAAGGSIGTAVLEKIGEGRIKKLSKSLNEATDPTEREKLEKRVELWVKINNIASHTRSFLSGGGLGLMVGGLINGLTMGGRGLIETMRSGKEGIQGAATGHIHEGDGVAQQAQNPPQGTANPAQDPTSNITETTTIEGTYTPGTGVESIPLENLGNTFDSGLTYQQASELGWKGTKLYLTETGGNHGVMQGEFFKKILDGLGGKISSMQGFEAAKAYNPFLRAAVNGQMNVAEAASKAVQAIQALP